MRRIKKKEREKAGEIYCSFCRKEHRKVIAVWRVNGLASHENGFACDEHYNLLPEERDDRITEADYQTWMRL